MFSQKKRIYERKSFYGMILVLLLGFGFWINQDPGTPDTGNDIKNPVVSTGEQIPSAVSKDSGNLPTTPDYNSPKDGDVPRYDPENQSDMDTVAGMDGEEDLDTANTQEITGPCFLIKEDAGYIKIYSVDESGASQLIRTTDILFSLLSEGDQKLFREGIVKQSKDELLDLLQDFES